MSRSYVLQVPPGEESMGITTRDLLSANDTLPSSNMSAESTAKMFPREFDACEDATSFTYVDYTQLASVRYVSVVGYILVLLVSIAGNIMVIWTVYKNKHMRTVTNYYIMNLALSDLLVALLVMPLKLLEYSAPCEWRVFAKDALCSFVYFILPVFVFVSVLTLVAISTERFYAVVHPFSSIKIHSKSRTRKIIIGTWMLSIVLASPYMFCKAYAFNIQSSLGSVSRQICTDRFDVIDVALYGDSQEASGRFRRGFFLFLFVVIYLVPLVTIVTTSVRIAMCLLQPIGEHPVATRYTRMAKKREENKRKVARMMIVVAMSFIISWTPFYIITFVTQVQSRSFLRDSNFLFTMLLIHWFGFLNSCINPIIYNFMNEKFHRSFKRMLSAISPRCHSMMRKNSLFLYGPTLKSGSHGFARTHCIRVKGEMPRTGSNLAENGVIYRKRLGISDISRSSESHSENSKSKSRSRSPRENEIVYFQSGSRNNYDSDERSTSSRRRLDKEDILEMEGFSESGRAGHNKEELLEMDACHPLSSKQDKHGRGRHDKDGMHDIEGYVASKQDKQTTLNIRGLRHVKVVYRASDRKDKEEGTVATLVIR